MWLYLIQGAGYGLAAASQPGPFQAYLVSQAVARGWKRALPIALAPLVSDALIIAVCLLALSRMPAWLERFLYLAGGLFVLRLAYSAFNAWRSFEAFPPSTVSNREQSVFKAALTNILNPNPYLFWILVTGPILLKGWREAPLNGVGFIAGFYLAMTTCLAGIIMVFGRRPSLARDSAASCWAFLRLPCWDLAYTKYGLGRQGNAGE
jgi:threonine/homoserine/homoserine lactone efflux protein